MIKNKKATDKIVSIYWFAILFIVAAAVVYMTIIFYGSPYDTREIEADILTNKIANCLSQKGYLNEAALDGNFQNNFFEQCSLNFNTEDVYDWKEQGQYYTKIDVSNFSSSNILSSFDAGNINLKEFCNQGKNSPICIERSFYSIDKQNNQYKINILSIVRKTEKNVK